MPTSTSRRVLGRLILTGVRPKDLSAREMMSALYVDLLSRTTKPRDIAVAARDIDLLIELDGGK